MHVSPNEDSSDSSEGEENVIFDEILAKETG